MMGTFRGGVGVGAAGDQIHHLAHIIFEEFGTAESSISAEQGQQAREENIRKDSVWLQDDSETWVKNIKDATHAKKENIWQVPILRFQSNPASSHHLFLWDNPGELLSHLLLGHLPSS